MDPAVGLNTSSTLDQPIPQAEPEHTWRDLLFVCDGHHAFATVGETDPTGDERRFALSRQARLIPVKSGRRESTAADERRDDMDVRDRSTDQHAVATKIEADFTGTDCQLATFTGRVVLTKQ
jgi:hypothetical protein